MKGAHQPWTPNEISALVADAEAGDDSRDIADRLGRTWAAVKGRAQRLGLALGRGQFWKVNIEARAQLLDTLREMPGISIMRAALVLGKHHTGLNQMVHLLAREGLVERVGTYGRGVRFLLTEKWFEGRRECACQYRAYRKAVAAALPWLRTQ